MTIGILAHPLGNTTATTLASRLRVLAKNGSGEYGENVGASQVSIES